MTFRGNTFCTAFTDTFVSFNLLIKINANSLQAKKIYTVKYIL